MAAKRRRPTFRAGDTILVTHQAYNHLYVVCSDPGADPDQVLIVNFTTFKALEETCCMVKAGEHPFIKHRSCIRYKDARILSVEALAKLLEGPFATTREPVSAELLDRIRQGAKQSEFLPEKCRQLLQSQSLI